MIRDEEVEDLDDLNEFLEYGKELILNGREDELYDLAKYYAESKGVRRTISQRPPEDQRSQWDYVFKQFKRDLVSADWAAISREGERKYD